MSKTLIVSYLPREGSNTRKLVDAYVDATGDSGEIIHRSLDSQTIPLVDKEVMASWWTPGADNVAETASSEFIAELESADQVIIATPMYNWSLPAPVKAWFDLVIRSGQTFEFGESGPKGLLDVKKGALFVTTGMTKIEGDTDHLSPMVKLGLGLMGVEDVTVVGAEELLICGEDEAAKRMEVAIEASGTLASNWSA